jgi:hypothetical protein
MEMDLGKYQSYAKMSRIGGSAALLMSTCLLTRAAREGARMTSNVLSEVALLRALRTLAAGALLFAGCAVQVSPDPAPTGSTSRTSDPGSIAVGGDIGGTASASGVTERAGDLRTACAGQIRRITDAEYVAKVGDVLHVTLGDSFVTTRGGTEPFTDALAVEYQTAAQMVSRQAVAPATMASLLGSDATTPATDAQLGTFFDTKVSALWQRSVTSSEAAVLRGIYRGTSTLGDDGPSRAFDLLLQAVLQAPSFLFRVECD